MVSINEEENVTAELYGFLSLSSTELYAGCITTTFLGGVYSLKLLYTVLS